MRYHGITPFGLEFTLNYFYQRFAGDDGTNYAPLRVLLRDPLHPKRDAKISRRRSSSSRAASSPPRPSTPYVHTIGVSANYSDETFTQAVFRIETHLRHRRPVLRRRARSASSTRPALPGVTKKNMWKGMIAFDRPTWIRSLNKKSTWFLTGQFFWHYLVEQPELRGAGRSRTCRRSSAHGRPARAWSAASTCRRACVRPHVSFRDKIRDWEALFTLAAFTLLPRRQHRARRSAWRSTR